MESRGNVYEEEREGVGGVEGSCRWSRGKVEGE